MSLLSFLPPTRDPTECGTYLGALQCSRTRCGGRLISPRPLEQEEPWQCDSCGEVTVSSYWLWSLASLPLLDFVTGPLLQERPAGEAAGALQLAVMEIEAVKERPGGETTADLEVRLAIDYRPLDYSCRSWWPPSPPCSIAPTS